MITASDGIFVRREAAAVLGLCSAIAAYGSFFIPQGYNLSQAWTGGYTAALVAFLAFYLTCLAATWWVYFRERAAERAPANVSPTTGQLPAVRPTQSTARRV